MSTAQSTQLNTAKLKTVTLGCKVNQYETEFVRQGLAGIGYQMAADEEQADLCIVNTCTVTNEGDAKSRRLIRKLHRKNPDAQIVVMGCYATRDPQAVAELPGVSEVITDKRELPDLLGRFGVVEIPRVISNFGSRHRAIVKVQDGCMLNCSFCIIPAVRPHLESRPSEHILEEIEALVNNGYREVVLTGIHLGHYGVEWNRNRPKSQWMRLSHLLEKIVQLSGDFQVRMSSIEATEVTRELIDVMAKYPERICPHLHVSMQSGSDTVLRRMKRRWGSRRFIDRCKMVRDRLDRPAFTTDIIVGFPGETEHEFEQTCQVSREVGFSKIHIFPFSPRRTTPAATMPDQISPEVKKDRGRRLAELEAELQQQYFKQLVGMNTRALLQGESQGHPNYLCGMTSRYATVLVPKAGLQIGDFVDVKIEKLAEGQLIAEPMMLSSV